MRKSLLLSAVCITAAPATALAQTEGSGDAPGEAAQQAADAVTAAAEEATEEATEEAQEGAEETPARPPARRFEDYATANPPTSTGTDAQAPIGGWQRLTEAELLDTTVNYPNVEWHGYFRFRADTFWNLDLDTAGTSPILPPVEALLDPDRPSNLQAIEQGDDELVNTGAERLSGANIRFRLRPIFNITEKTRIHLEMNILDNLMLGSTPDGYSEDPNGNGGLRTDMPLIAFSGSQEPPNLYNAARNSISVTQAYGEVNTFFGTIRLGRMASHWGLGILANGGGNYSTLREPRVSYRGGAMAGHSCVDCDYGDYVDRAMFVTNLFDHYIALAWDYNFAGPTDMGFDDYYGQARDLSQYDDVRSVVASVFSRPLRDEEIAERNRTLKELRRPAFDYGAYFVARRQRISPEGTNVSDQADVTNIDWYNRDAKAFIPDLWFRLVSEPRFRTRLRLEGEVAMIFGHIGNASPNDQSSEKERDVRQLGAALELDYTRNALATGINAGVATGRTFVECGAEETACQSDRDNAATGFGVNDSWSVREDEPTITNFKFDRNYFVDAIMFREIVGTITNAVYANPFFAYDLFSKQDDTLGLRLDLISAMALSPEATPSGESWFGLETDLTLYYREPNYGASLMGGLFLPGSVFEAVDGRTRITGVSNVLDVSPVYDADSARNANPAFTVQGAFYWAF